MSDSLPPHGFQHARLPCPSLSPRVCSNSCAESAIPSNHLIVCCPPLLLPSAFPRIRIFSSESVLQIKRPKYWRLSISPCNAYSGLISSRTDWLGLLAVQGALKSLLQHNLKAPVLRFLAFLMVQLSHLYMTAGQTIALSKRTFAGKATCLLFHVLSRFAVAFLAAGVY